MVAEQRETVQRIDADTQDIAQNINMGHNELLKYWGRVSNDRWLMLKIFGVLIVFVRSCCLGPLSPANLLTLPHSSCCSFWYHDGLYCVDAI